MYFFTLYYLASLFWGMIAIGFIGIVVAMLLEMLYAESGKNDDSRS
jgi:hypothetical protein